MEKEMSKVNSRIGRGKYAIFAIVGFLALITYLLITISTQLTSVMLTTDSDAALRIGSRMPGSQGNPITLNRGTGEGSGQRTIESGVITSPSTGATEVIAQCGQGCFYALTDGQKRAEGRCAAGLECRSIPIGAGAIGLCFPAGQEGYSCPAPTPTPLPTASCGQACGNRDGQYMSCPGGTSCQVFIPGTQLRRCLPTGTLSCEDLANQSVTNPGPGGASGRELPVVPVEPVPGQ